MDGDWIQFNSMTDCKEYDCNNNLVATITPTGTLAPLAEGANTVSFNGGASARASVTMSTYDVQSANFDAALVGNWRFEEFLGIDDHRFVPLSKQWDDLGKRHTRDRHSGNALQFNGTNAYATIPASSSLNSITGSFTVGLSFQYGGAGTAGKSSWTLVSKNPAGSGYDATFQVYIDSSDYHLCANVGSGASQHVLDSGVAVNDGRFHQVALVYDDIIKAYTLYLDGNAVVTQAVPSTWTIFANTAPVTLGCWPAYNDYFNGIIDELQIYSRPLSASEIAAQTGGPVGNWRFEETSGTTINDSSSYQNNGTISNVTRVPGISGNALKFNGTNAYATIPASSSLNAITGSFSVALSFQYGGAGPAGKSTWTLLNKNPAGSGYDAAFQIYIDTTDCHLCANVGNGTSQHIFDSGVAVNDGRFHQVALVYDDIDKTYTLYLDGNAAATQVMPSTWMVFANAAPVTLGCWPAYNDYFNGIIDEVQIYNRPLSASEITAQTGGPVVNLHFEEPSGTTINDSSSYQNNGTLSSTVTRVPGISGNALQFNGTNAYATIPASNSVEAITGSFTAQLSFEYGGPGPAGKNSWTLLSKDPGGSGYDDPFQIYISPTNYHLWASVGDTGVGQYVLDSGVAVNDGCFHDVAMVYNGATFTYTMYLDGNVVVTQVVPSTWVIANNTAPVTLGCWPAYNDYFNGIIDNVQIYNRPLSASEITAQESTPVGNWQFTEMSGPTILDSSLCQNNGTISSNVTRVASGAGTGGLQFNGVNTYASIPASPSLNSLTTGSFTVQLTFQYGGPGPAGLNMTLISKNQILDPFNASDPFQIYIDPSTLHLIAHVGNGTRGSAFLDAGVAVNDGLLHSVSLAYNSATLTYSLFYDGNVVATQVMSAGWTPATNNAPITLGTSICGTYFNGIIKNVRVYDSYVPTSSLANAGPEVEAIRVGGSSWTSGSLTGGYLIPVGSGAQLLPLPWSTINQISVTFNENVTVDQSDLLLTGVNVLSYNVAGGTFSYDSTTFTASWTLPQSIGADELMLSLNANGSSPIQDAAGNHLDGEWTNPVSTTNRAIASIPPAMARLAGTSTSASMCCPAMPTRTAW